ncbi:oxidoreductase [Marmoricola endophyticus]|uniref:Oxidoreductase n=1 Tax=Marmoricola endophyticus TaxID=2040280 RepID=A0A917BBA3_9ACTN|nr:SDR family NAD(P)-dependent oxidoreductase [Marmoricola endophyticus]GGF34623.1 oxidoreductase [Marmoricola endophyticus]
MSTSLQNASVLITGASSGIGAATARLLAADGAVVALVARRRERLDDLVEDIAAAGGTAHAYAADVADSAEATTVVDRVAVDLGGLDALVGCAGYLANMPALEADLAEWHRMVSVNVDGVLATTHAALPHLVRSASGPRGVADVVTISSIAGRRVPQAYSQVYAATKHAVGAFSEGLRQELAEKQVRVGLVEPGVVRTEMTTAGYTGAPDGSTGAPLGAEDVADAVRYILTRPAHAAVNEVLLRPTEQVR